MKPALTYAELERKVGELTRKCAAYEAERNRLTERETYLRQMFDRAPVGYQSLDQDGNFIEVNQTWLDILGYTREEVIGRNFAEFLDPEWRGHFQENFPRFKSLGEILGVEFKMVAADGRLIWVAFQGRIGRNAQGGFLQTHCIFEDISQRKRAEERLRRYEQIFTSTPDGIALLDTQYRYLEVNASYERFSGMAREQFVGRSVADYLGEAFFEEQVRPHFDRCLAGEIIQYQSWVDFPALGRRFVHVNYFPYRKPDQGIAGIVAVTRDATDLKRMEEALHQEALRRRILIEQSRDGIVILDEYGKVCEANPRFADMLGYSLEELQELNVWDWDTQWTREQLLDMLQTVDEGGDHFETRQRRKDGTLLDVEVSTNGAVFDGRRMVFCICRDVSGRKQAESRLRESEEKFRLAFQMSPDAISLIRFADGKVIAINEGFTTILGYGADEVVGKTTRQLEVWAQPRERKQLMAALEQHGFVENMEVRLRASDGGMRIGLISARRLIINQEDVVISITRDITERKNIERALRQSELKYRVLSEELEKTIEILNLINKADTIEELLERVIGMIREWQGIDAAAVRLRQAEDYPYRLTLGFSREFVAAEQHLCVRDSAGRPVRDSNGDALLACLCGSVISGAQDASRPFFTAQGSFWTNNTSQFLAGLTDAQRPQQARYRCFLQGYESMALIPLRAGAETFGLLQFNVRRKDFFSRPLLSFLEGVADQLALAISKRWTEEALRASEERLRQAQKLARVGYWDWFPETDELHWSDEVFPIFGRDKAAFKPTVQAFEAGMHPEDLDEFQARRRELLERGWETSFEHRIVLPDGSLRYVNETAMIVRDADGRPVQVMGTVQDITERRMMELAHKQLENRLQHAQKMESIGTLAGGIAHDFNNILFPLVGFAELLREDLDPDNPLQVNVAEILNAALRARDLVKQILTYSRQAEPELKTLRLQPIIHDALRLLRSSIPKTIEMVQDIDPDCGPMIADSTHIHQIVMNLATNAYHAMEKSGGRLHVALDQVNLRTGEIKDADLKPGRYARLTVADTGAGMEKSVLERIFEPYFTTKEKSKGTGLGLSVVQGIVKSLGGDIRVSSRVGQGTEFVVCLPLIGGSGEQKPVKPPERLARGSESILLVDDEEAIVRMVRMMLERLGYKVAFFTSSSEALETFKADPHGFDLVISDMTMPQMTGDQLAIEIRKIRPGIPFILCTGFSERIDPQSARALGNTELLIKPIVRAELAALLRRILDAGGGL